MLPVLASQALSFAFSDAVRLRFRGRSLLTKDDSFPIRRTLTRNQRFSPRSFCVRPLAYSSPSEGDEFLAGCELVTFRILDVDTEQLPGDAHGLFTVEAA